MTISSTNASQVFLLETSEISISNCQWFVSMLHYSSEEWWNERDLMLKHLSHRDGTMVQSLVSSLLASISSCAWQLGMIKSHMLTVMGETIIATWVFWELDGWDLRGKMVWKLCWAQHNFGLTKTFMDFKMPDGLLDREVGICSWDWWMQDLPKLQDK
jgi:hypothetical protein